MPPFRDNILTYSTLALGIILLAGSVFFFLQVAFPDSNPLGQWVGLSSPPESNPNRKQKTPPGAWHQTKKGETSSQQKEKIKSLQALGYFSGYEEASSKNGVVRDRPDSSFRGLNLYVSGHAPEARLVDMQGRLVHKWRLPYEEAFPDTPPTQGATGARNWRYWRKFHLYPNGDLLAIFAGHGLIKVDRDSNLLWARHNKAHHDLWVSETTGKIYVLTRKGQMIRKIHPRKPVLDDRISVLSAGGDQLRHVSLIKSLWESNHFPLMNFVRPHGDVLHTNTLEILEDSENSKIPSVFGNNNALVSFNVPNTIAVVDLQKEEVIWQLTGMSNRNHDPTLLDNGNLLFFDNTGHYNHSQVEEIDPVSQQIVWSYDGTKENGFRTKSGGTNQRLPNGNTLITETEAGRAFEVTPNGEIVWEWFSPHRAGEDNELVASLFEVKRYSEDYFEGWSPTSDRE